MGQNLPAFSKWIAKRTLIKRPRVSEPTETDTDDEKLVDLTRCDAADDEAAVRSTENKTSQFLNPAYSDLSIICGDKVFPAYRVIGLSSGDKGEIEINVRDATLVAKMLQFVYTDDYTCDTHPETVELVTATYLSPTADTKEETAPVIAPVTLSRSDIEGLKAKAKERFEKTFLNTANEHSFAATVIEVYASTAENDRGPRDIVVQLTRNNLPQLRTGQDPILSAHILQLIPQFMLDIYVSTRTNVLGTRSTVQPGPSNNLTFGTVEDN
ncbi:hypothetical protein GB937_006661 [Aspergillus fischeri]|nr:hypothetical protein GB937_006661 [Aspergillus fischeri]